MQFHQNIHFQGKFPKHFDAVFANSSIGLCVGSSALSTGVSGKGQPAFPHCGRDGCLCTQCTVSSIVKIGTGRLSTRASQSGTEKDKHRRPITTTASLCASVLRYRDGSISFLSCAFFPDKCGRTKRNYRRSLSAQAIMHGGIFYCADYHCRASD